MDELLKLKKSLKLWETEFYKQRGKKPGKADIDEASSEIQDCYTKYTKIKKILKETGNHTNQSAGVTNQKDSSPKRSEENDELANGHGGTDLANQNEEELANQDGEEKIEVWGSQFNRKSSSVKEIEKVPAQKKESSAYLQKLGSKMFQQSLKQNNKKVSTQRPKSWGFQSQNMLTNNDGIAQEDNVENMISEDLLCKEIDEMSGTGQTDKEMTTESEETAARFGRLFEKASSISKPKTENSKDDFSDCFIGKFKSRFKPKQTVLPSSLSKVVCLHKEKYGEPDYEAESCDQDGVNFGGKKSERADIDEFDNEFEKEFQKAIVERSTYTEWKRDESSKSTTKVKKDFKATNEIKSDLDTQVASYIKSDSRAKEAQISTEKEQSATKSTIASDNVYEFENENTDTKSPVKFARGKRTRVSRVKSDTDKVKNENTDSEKTDMVSEADKEDYDVNCDDDSDDDNVGGKRKRKRTTESGTDKKPVKRRKTATECAAETDDGESTATIPVRKPVAKSKPVSSENFIKLNMKIKTYKRKGKTMSGPQYKRKMWKQKMQARSKSYGDSCFKCGQSGHWANKCPGNQSSGTSSTGEPVMDEDFPSLQEAAMLARGVKVEEQRKLKTVSDTIETDKADTQTEPAPNIGSIEEDEELRLEAGIVRSRLDDPPPPPAMDPLIQIGENDPIPEIPDFVKKGLKKFGFDSFRPGQEESVMRILCGLSTLVVLSTGGGKSLCYQLPAYLYAQRSKCITLVVSPLVSLMEDQVTGLPQGIRGVCLHTNMTASQRESVLGAVKDGKAQFLLVSPEAIAGGSMSLVSSMSSLPPIAFACIDEAHCLSEWSHNFRPSYLRLCKVLKDKLGVRCFLGLTATATLSTASDVSRHLGITDFRRATVRGSPIPDNLYLSVSRDENRDEAIVGLLQGDRFCNLESIIIYCTRRDVTDRVATLIRTCLNKGVPQEVTAKKGRKKGIKLEWDAESYHAGLTPAQRKRVQNAFMSGRLRVVVATVAFGMGLDKSDVRGIIHYNMPKSFESYVQEIGRAGRDREPAQCHVFLDPEEEVRRFHHGLPTDLHVDEPGPVE